MFRRLWRVGVDTDGATAAQEAILFALSLVVVLKLLTILGTDPGSWGDIVGQMLR